MRSRTLTQNDEDAGLLQPQPLDQEPDQTGPVASEDQRPDPPVQVMLGIDLISETDPLTMAHIDAWNVMRADASINFLSAPAVLELRDNAGTGWVTAYNEIDTAMDLLMGGDGNARHWYTE